MSEPKARVRKKRRRPHPRYPAGGRPTWEVAYLFPPQGSWAENEFLALHGLEIRCPRIELAYGRLEILPVPTRTHQLILIFLFEQLKAFASAHAPGLVLFNTFRIRLPNGHHREPDIMYMKAENANRQHEEYWDGADLVMEVVSGSSDDRKRDLVEKVRDYADAAIPEYWIIDPDQRRIQVMSLAGADYTLHGEFVEGMDATSVLLPGFQVSVAAVMAAPLQ